jgi:hypothetical protein
MQAKSVVVHVLWKGQALCGFSKEAPKDWPSGHKWTRPSDVLNITCPECKDKVHECKT